MEQSCDAEDNAATMTKWDFDQKLKSRWHKKKYTKVEGVSAEPAYAEDILSFLHIILCVILSLKWQRSQNWGRHERRAEGVGKSRRNNEISWHFHYFSHFSCWRWRAQSLSSRKFYWQSSKAVHEVFQLAESFLLKLLSFQSYFVHDIQLVSNIVSFWELFRNFEVRMLFINFKNDET